MYWVYIDSKKEETANIKCKHETRKNYKLFCFYFLYINVNVI